MRKSRIIAVILLLFIAFILIGLRGVSTLPMSSQIGGCIVVCCVLLLVGEALNH